MMSVLLIHCITHNDIRWNSTQHSVANRVHHTRLLRVAHLMNTSLFWTYLRISNCVVLEGNTRGGRGMRVCTVGCNVAN